jgi:hypothetical protein
MSPAFMFRSLYQTRGIVTTAPRSWDMPIILVLRRPRLLIRRMAEAPGEGENRLWESHSNILAVKLSFLFLAGNAV